MRICVKRLFLVVLFAMAGCQEPASYERTHQAGRILKEELDSQLEINKDALLKGSSEQIRVYAAAEMLQSEDPRPRKILLDVLKNFDNTESFSAVCKALIQVGAEQKPVNNKSEFIQPLLDVLVSADTEKAKLAAEALLAFEYEQMSKKLEKMAKDPSQPTPSRLNAIYALKLQPSKKATITLMSLVNDSNGQVSLAAKRALRSLNVPIAKTPQLQKQVIEQLQQKQAEVFLHSRLLAQTNQIRQFETELQELKQLYLNALDQIYDGLADDKSRSQFLLAYLNSPRADVRLWALQLVSDWRQSTKPELPSELGNIVLSLVSDKDRDVRLKAAQLLSLMSEVNSSQKIFEQIAVEEDEQVKIELLLALSWACYYDALPDSQVELSPQNKNQTLFFASEYLFKDNPANVQKSAEVIGRLLGRNGLSAQDVDKYLGMFKQRYQLEHDKTDGVVKRALLDTMAGLCAQTSMYRDKAAILFNPLFHKALQSEDALIRQKAMQGLINIDKKSALEVLRERFVNDENPDVRKRLINLAEEVGQEQDLVWLWEKAGSAEENPAWQAMMRIFKDSDLVVLNKWMDKFTTESKKDALTEQKLISFLEIVEGKIANDGKWSRLKDIRGKLVKLYKRNGQFEKATDCLWRQYNDSKLPEDKNESLKELLHLNFAEWRNAKAALNIFQKCLLEKDLDPNGVVVSVVDSYLSKLPDGADPNIILEALSGMIIPEDKPEWKNQVKNWKQRLKNEKK